jgi:RNA polymerase sigma-70 factor (ECF subfamily)
MNDPKVAISGSDFAAFVSTGDNKIFRKIYDQYVGLMLFIASKYLKSKNDIEDVVQDVFATFYRDRATLEKPGWLKSWLVMATRNKAIDVLRKRKNEVVVDTMSQDFAAYDDRESFRAELSIAVVREIFDELAASGQAGEMKMFYVDGLKAADIAQRLGLSISGVTTNLTRQRRKFAELIKRKIEEVLERQI